MSEPHTPIDQMLDPDGDDKNRADAPQPSDPARAIRSVLDPDAAGETDPTTQPRKPLPPDEGESAR